MVGENGAGKSTLLNISSGVFPPDGGTLLFDGQPIHLASPRKASALGIAMIHQELAGLEHLTVAQNMLLGHEPLKWRSLIIDTAKMNDIARRHIQRLHTDIAVTAKLEELSIGRRQMVEIAKALSLNAQLLIMDEPTSALSSKEITHLYAIIDALKREGITIMYISHRLEEVFAMCDTVTVLRDGAHVATTAVAEVTTGAVIEMMVGEHMSATKRSAQAFGAQPLIEIERLSAAQQFSDVSFRIRTGEVFGLFGLLGAGRTELAHALYGLSPADSGSIRLEGREIALRSVSAAQSSGIAYVPEDRKRQGLFANQTVRRNTIAVIARRLSRLMWLPTAKTNATVGGLVKRLNVRTDSIHATVSKLSGGNQQKVILARWLAAEPKLLILDEPTRGIDVRAKAQIYELIDALATEGMSILLISSELPEIFRMSDTIGVMRNGRLVLTTPHQKTSIDAVMKYATGEIGNE